MKISMGSKKNETAHVSIIITTKNEEKNIGNCLNSILRQTYSQKFIEIIVVDNNSWDSTKSIAKQYTSQVYNKGPERSAQRNFGAHISKGEYLLYLDADMILDKSVILESVTLFQNNQSILGLYIPEIITGTSFWNRVRRFERSFYNATVIDCVRIVRTNAFREVGGFDETLSGPEDWDFDKKIRSHGKVDIITAPLFHNETSIDLFKYLRKKSYYSQSMKMYIKKWGRNDPDIKKQLGVYYRFCGVFLEKGKWKKFVTHPILALTTLILKLQVGIAYLHSSIVMEKK